MRTDTMWGNMDIDERTGTSAVVKARPEPWTFLG
jgi:hypothetical protein